MFSGHMNFFLSRIPYTHDNTNFHRIEKGTKVNIEFDILGKYLARIMTTQQ